MLTGVQSVVIEVEDFPAAAAHYATLLGQEEPAFLGRLQDESGGTRRVALFPVANTTLEIRERAETAEAPLGLSTLRLEAEVSGDGLQRFRDAGIRSSPPVVERAIRVQGGSDDADTNGLSSTVPPNNREVTWAAVDPESSRKIGVEFVEEAPSNAPLTLSAAIEAKSSIRALDHVVVLSGDIDATRIFYGEGLGIRLALDRVFEKRGVRLIFFRLGGVTIEVGGRIHEDAQPAAADRFGGLAWQVNSIDSIQARLLAEEFDVSEIRDGNKPGTRVCTVRNPVHGVPTLLIEPVSR